jgi:hypothetical protein
MDIAYAGLARRRTGNEPPAGEVAEIVGVLWAHATAEDELQYVSGRSKSDRVDLPLHLLTAAVSGPAGEHRTTALLAGCHRASRRVQRDYLPAQPLP